MSTRVPCPLVSFLTACVCLRWTTQPCSEIPRLHCDSSTGTCSGIFYLRGDILSHSWQVAAPESLQHPFSLPSFPTVSPSWCILSAQRDAINKMHPCDCSVGVPGSTVLFSLSHNKKRGLKIAWRQKINQPYQFSDKARQYRSFLLLSRIGKNV